ncbi:AMP-binding protein [Oryctes borbonicus]|uniref:AMP-binding protein n=1 Tax=Oryctes borbonicus TaxID=1629725 RepID=A0A0T6BAZ6_9SCAR|nr:AMP-binding protein [Oryctes borbonicus]
MGDVTYHITAGMDQLRQQDKVPIGLPINNTIIYILDPNLHPVKIGDVGELYVSGLNVADGYVGDRDPDKFIKNHLTANPTYAKLYRTGDFARIQNGVIIYEGRTDSQVKIRGHRVNLLEVENAIISIEGIQNATVLCYKPEQISQTLLAFVLTRVTTNEHHIEEFLRKKLPAYMVPQVIILDKIPLLVNGKVDRQLLLKLYDNANSNENSLQANIDYKDIPQEKIKAATVLFEAVASILNRAAKTTICIDANFYNIGGNSLNSIYTIMALSEKGYNISIGDFIAAKNLGEVLDKIDNNQGSFSISQQPMQTSYTAELLKDEHKADVLEIISSSFYEKGDLEQWVMPNNFVEDYWNMIDGIWKPLVDNALCFVAKNKDGCIDGVALNYDAENKPKARISAKLDIVFGFLETIECPVRYNTLINLFDHNSFTYCEFQG